VSKQKRPEKSEARRFALILGGMCALIASLSLWRHHETRAGIMAGIAVAAVACMLIAPPLWGRIFRLWMKLGKAITWALTHLILSAFFFLILTPFGLVSRLFRKDPLDLSWKARRTSYWVDKRSEEPTLDRYERQF
jgi:hypothetical protein